MRKILVTGGAGFIGSHIVDKLLGNGVDLRVMDDLSSGSKSNLPSDITLYEQDIRSLEARKSVSEFRPDVIVHAAAQISVRVSMEDPTLDVATNVVGLVNILQGMKGAKPYVVFLSTGGAIYGESAKIPSNEGSLIQPESIYGLSKRVSELYLEFWQRSFGVPYVSLRLSNVYGPRQNPHGEAGVVAIFCKALLHNKTPIINGSGKQTRDFVYVEDVANAVRVVVERQAVGIWNIGTGAETDINRLYEVVVGSLNKKIEPMYGPAKCGEQLRSCVDPSKAKTELNWVPGVSFEEGIRRTTDWFSKQRS